MKRQNNDPSWLTVGYSGRCSKCKDRLRKGTTAYYFPKGKTTLCADCGSVAFLAYLMCNTDEAVFTSG